MISLADDLRESEDSLDIVLKRHNTNLQKEMWDSHKPCLPEERKKWAYITFKQHYLYDLDMSVDEICEEMGITVYVARKFSTRIIKETGMRRCGLKNGETQIRRVK